ncbi:MAG: thiamine ABC transporter substrate-binding protein [Spirochaetaceae bacterium]|jgi:thiamine transport system substrate-binding protein|nr:thiamine ABC transporter substrate-binding protein [Spirochaetaceae bacterium]
MLSHLQKKLLATVCVALVVLGSCAGCSKTVNSKNLTIWTYDSFYSEWGPGLEIARRFKEESGIEIKWESTGDAGSLLSKIILEGPEAGADIIIGLDQNMGDRAIESGLFEAYKPLNAAAVFPELVVYKDFALIPFDYSYFAINYDSEKIGTANRPAVPASLEDLTKAEYAKKLILIDPRTSSPGLGFAAWVKEIYKDQWKDYWQRLKPSILTVADSWDTAYGLYTAGEAPLVLSYTTSPAYHLENEGSSRYRAAIFAEGHPIQIEFAGLLAAAKNKEAAKLFLDFMLKPSFQETIPLGNWMYPAIDIPLPDCFSINPKSDKPLYPKPLTDEELDQWAELF